MVRASQKTWTLAHCSKCVEHVSAVMLVVSMLTCFLRSSQLEGRGAYFSGSFFFNPNAMFGSLEAGSFFFNPNAMFGSLEGEEGIREGLSSTLFGCF